MQPRISVKQVVQSVIRNLGVQNAASEFNNFVEWAFEAEKKIGSFKTFIIKEVSIPINNKQAALPEDFLELIDIKNNNNIYYEAEQKPFKENDRGTSHNTYYMSNGFIRFSESSDTSINISYTAIDTDAEGYPTIEANHEDAVSAYLMYKYKAKDYYNQKLPKYIYDDLKRDWFRLCAQARGNDNMPNRNQMRAISKYWNSLVPHVPRH